MRRRALIPAALAACAAFAIPASAYYHFVYYLSSGRAAAKFDLAALPDKTVWFFVSEAGPTSFSANDNFSSVIGQIRQATAVWNGVASSDLRVGFGGFENANTQQNTPAADVVFDDLAPGLLGFGGPTITGTAANPGNAAAAATGTPFVPILRSAIHLNVNGLAAPFPSYSASFFMTMLHEMGHALGLQHTFTSATMSTATTSATSQANPLDVDDIAGISALYPNANFAKTGSIAGHITSGGGGVHLESVVAIRAGASAVSALTNPDGSYEIDGVPPGQYYVYAHALPPDADIAGPWNADGSVAAGSGPTNTQFYPGTTDLLQATPVAVKAGSVLGGIDIAVTNLPAVPIYDVAVYGYYADNTVAIKPAYLNMLVGKTTVAASGVGLGSGGQAPGLNAVFMGSSAIVTSGGVRPYGANGNTYIALDVVSTPFSSTGAQHLIITTPDFMHVLPAAVRLTQQGPPDIESVTTNADGTVTVTGTNWMAGSAIYFDGLPATVLSLVMKGGAGTAIVAPPPGIGGQTAVLTAYNPDGQNSQFVQAENPASYTYGGAPAQTIVAINPATLPAGAEAMIDITGSGFNLAAGQTALGFGTSDIVVRRIFVLGPNHLQADVSVAPGAALASPDVSLFSGFQQATALAGFHITSPVSNLPAPVPTLTNGLPGLTGAYAGAIVSLYGANLTLANATPVVTFNDQAAAILYSSPTQINLVVPTGLAAGPARLTVFNGAVNSYPVIVNVDTPPATITGIQDSSGSSIGASVPAVQGGLLTVNLSGFAADGTAIDPARVQVGVAGLLHPVLTVTQGAPGVYQVNFLLNQNEPTGNSQAVIVYLDGRSSYPVTIPVAASTFTASTGWAWSSFGN